MMAISPQWLRNLRLNYLWVVAMATVCALLLPIHAVAEPQLEIVTATQTRTLGLAELLRHPALQTIQVQDDPSYKRPMRYLAIPFAALVPNIGSLDTVQFTAKDGFVGNIPGPVLAGAGKPYLAIETTDAPWPALRSGNSANSAGPFYLVWLDGPAQGIASEQWPYAVVKIKEVASYTSRFPLIVAPHTAAGSTVEHGMQMYIKHCAVCHTLNGAGDGAIGPDLNRPHSPVEYFNEAFLRQLVRDPASVRSWPQRAMPGFSSDTLSDSDLNDLLAYFKQMAQGR